jgi:SAM-dependent methyltransferase
MHPTAIANCQQFFATYANGFPSEGTRVVEIGSQDVNGNLRSCSPPNFAYTGVDFVVGNGVDVVLDDPYSLPFATGSTDIVLSSSCFEHSELFWLLFLEIMRILKPCGVFYLNAPSNGGFHRYPVDCWRFYPDSGGALVTWARRNGVNSLLLESYTSVQVGDLWNDFVAVYVRDAQCAAQHPKRILDSKTDIYNGIRSDQAGFMKFSPMPEDQKKLHVIKSLIDNQVKII